MYIRSVSFCLNYIVTSFENSGVCYVLLSVIYRDKVSKNLDRHGIRKSVC